MFLSFQESFCFAHLTKKKNLLLNYVMRRCQCWSYTMQGIPTRHLVSIRCNSSVSQLKRIPFHEVNNKSWFWGQKNCNNFHLKRSYLLLNCCHRARARESLVSKQLASRKWNSSDVFKMHADIYLVRCYWVPSEKKEINVLLIKPNSVV